MATFHSLLSLDGDLKHPDGPKSITVKKSRNNINPMNRNDKNDLSESYPIIISWMWIRSSIMMMNLLLGVVVLLLRRMMLSVIGWQTDGHSMLIDDGQISHLENVLNTSFWKPAWVLRLCESFHSHLLESVVAVVVAVEEADFVLVDLNFLKV